MDEPITKSQIDFIRPRIEHGGWYYGDHHADVIGNNAIDDIEVCLQLIDEQAADLSKKDAEIDRLLKRVEMLDKALSAAIKAECDCGLSVYGKFPCVHAEVWWMLREAYKANGFN